MGGKKTYYINSYIASQRGLAAKRARVTRGVETCVKQKERPTAGHWQARLTSHDQTGFWLLPVRNSRTRDCDCTNTKTRDWWQVELGRSPEARMPADL